MELLSEDDLYVLFYIHNGDSEILSIYDNYKLAFDNIIDDVFKRRLIWTDGFVKGFTKKYPYDYKVAHIFWRYYDHSDKKYQALKERPDYHDLVRDFKDYLQHEIENKIKRSDEKWTYVVDGISTYQIQKHKLNKSI